MNINVILKRIMVFLPIMIIASCSFNKQNKSNQSSENISSNNDIDIMMFPKRDEEKVSEDEDLNDMKIEKIQRNNVIYFDLDKYDIRSCFTMMLDNHADLLCKYPSYKVTIEGHADERGTPEYNISLGERRANAIRKYLQNKGVSSNRIFIVSYGKEKPVAYGHYEEAYAKNRRAVIVY